MNLFERVSRVMTTNLDHAVDRAEDAEVMIRQLVREIEDSIVEVRRESVAAIVRVQQINRKIVEAGAAADVDCQTSLALRDELRSARRLQSQLKDHMLRLEAKATEARRRRDDLTRRQSAAEASPWQIGEPARVGQFDRRRPERSLAG